MNKHELIRKLTSRKFIISAISALAGIVIAIIGHDHEIATVAGALMSIVPAAVYCIMEGKIDAASVKAIGDAAAQAAEELGATEAAEHIEAVAEVAEIVAGDHDGEAVTKP